VLQCTLTKGRTQLPDRHRQRAVKEVFPYALYIRARLGREVCADMFNSTKLDELERALGQREQREQA
jgi:hypothetical protein